MYRHAVEKWEEHARASKKGRKEGTSSNEPRQENHIVPFASKLEAQLLPPQSVYSHMATSGLLCTKSAHLIREAIEKFYIEQTDKVKALPCGSR